MATLPNNLYTADLVRELDRQAIEVHGLPGLTLMESAGEAIFNVLREVWPEAWKIVVVCGAGNNAGDGYVIARLAQQHGGNVALLTATDPAKLTGDARTCAERCLEAGVKVEPFSFEKLTNADLIIDAVLGTGLDRDIKGLYLQIVQAINIAKAPVLAVDIPSGLNADTGRIMGEAIRAQVTISFIGLKQGLFTGEGPACAGQVYFDHLNVPDEIYQDIPVSSSRVDRMLVKKKLKPRFATGHKGDYGHAMIIGGEKGFSGAARMASEAAGRAGAGLVSLATRQEHASQITMVRPEIMAHGIESSNELVSLLKKMSVIGIGPGLGQGEWGQEMFATALESTLPLVVDADALNLLASEPSQRDNWILTPHPGEASRLLGISIDEVQNDRFNAITLLQERYGGTCVLKGAGTLIISRKGQIAVCNQGNPGMATGGMGDILTGVISGLVAQGLDLFLAAQLGVVVHANAGDVVAKNGQRGMLAMDLMPKIRTLINP